MGHAHLPLKGEEICEVEVIISSVLGHFFHRYKAHLAFHQVVK